MERPVMIVTQFEWRLRPMNNTKDSGLRVCPECKRVWTKDEVVSGDDIRMGLKLCGVFFCEIHVQILKVPESFEWETEKKSYDWIAFVKGDRVRWEAGPTEKDAVFKLIQSRVFNGKA